MIRNIQRYIYTVQNKNKMETISRRNPIDGAWQIYKIVHAGLDTTILDEPFDNMIGLPELVHVSRFTLIFVRHRTYDKEMKPLFWKIISYIQEVLIRS